MVDFGVRPGFHEFLTKACLDRAPVVVSLVVALKIFVATGHRDVVANRKKTSRKLFQLKIISRLG